MMKKTIRTILILFVLFIAGAIFFSIQINRQSGETAETEENPVLPVAFMQVDGTSVNEMFGVREALREEELRDSVTPLPADRTLTLQIQTNGNPVNGVSYQITEPDGEDLVENGQLTDLQTGDNGVVTVSFTLQGNIRSAQEYTLRFAVDTGAKDPIYYYTRLVQGGGVSLSDYFTFAENFRKMCLDKNQADALSTYLESDDTASNRSFTDVDIHSSSDLVSWGNLDPKEVTEPTPVIKEVNATTASIELQYLIQAENANDETEYYMVTDDFRMGHLANGKDVSLLNFNRSACLLFDGSNQVQTDTGLDLGVQNRDDIEVRNNKNADIAAFVVNGDLWSYNQNTGEIVKIFSFRKKDEAEADDRTELTQHGISIENVSDAGDVTFVVYGYMAVGSHEGDMGVAVYDYSAETHASTEKMFIPLAQGYTNLRKNLSRLSYVTANQELYLFLGTELCRIHLVDGSYTVVQDAIDADGFVVSDSQRTAAWVEDGNAGGSKKATIMDFESGKTFEIDAPEGEGIVACGFMNEDFVYGLVRQEDILEDSNKQAICGMNTLVIEDSSGDVKKQYTQENEYVTGTKKESEGMELTLSTKNGNTYKAAGTDHIMNNENQDAQVSLSAQVYERTGQKIMLNFPDTVTSPDLSYIEGKMQPSDAAEETVLEWPDTTPENYYVYGVGQDPQTFSQVNLAIQAADSISGVVLNRAQQYIWVRGDWGTSYTIDTTSLPAGVVSAGMDARALSEGLGDDYTVMDLTGVSQDDLKYFLANGSAVLAQGDDTVYCVVGYDAYNIWVYDAETGEPKAIASDDSEAEFQKHGNQFLSYRKN